MAAEVLALLPGPPPRWMFAAALARGATDPLPPRTGGSRSRSSARTPSRWEDAPSHPPAPWRKRYRADATGTQRVGAGLSGSRHRGAVRVPTPCGHPRRPAQISPARLFSPRPRRRSARRTSHRLELTHAGRLTAIPLWTVVTSNDQPNARCTRGSPEPEISQEDEHHDHDTDDVKDVVHPGLSFYEVFGCQAPGCGLRDCVIGPGSSPVSPSRPEGTADDLLSVPTACGRAPHPVFARRRISASS